MQDALDNAPTTARRWRDGVENAVVLWATSLLLLVVVWVICAWLVRQSLGVDYGWRSAASPWILGISTVLCALLAVISSVRWVKGWKDIRPGLRDDLAAAQVVEEHYLFDAAKRFQEPEHGGLMYFLHTTDDRVLTLFDHESQNLGVREKDPLASSFRPTSKLIMVRAPVTGLVISMAFENEPLDAGEPVELAVPPEQWPETEQYCGIPWSRLKTALGSQGARSP